MLSLRREDGRFVILNKFTEEDVTDMYMVTLQGESGIIVSAKKLKVNEVELDGEPVQFYEFHVFNPESQVFECISTIPNAVLKNYLEKLKETESQIGWIGLKLEEKKAKKGKRSYYDFPKVVVGKRVADKRFNVDYEDCSFDNVVEDENLFEF